MTADPRLIPTASAVRLIRAQLKQHFPQQAFRVELHRADGVASIRVHWIDGPDRGAVGSVVAPFKAKRDGSASYFIDAEPVRFDIAYIFCERD